MAASSLYPFIIAWPWQLWIFVAILVPLIGTVVLLHVIRAYQTRILVQKVIELGLCFFFFMAPLMPSPYFHLHHWYAGWFLGMHCNFDESWSRLVMAWCWGMYINGIAVYGRDPVLTCEYAFFLTVDQHCPYVKCYLEAMAQQHNVTANISHPVQEMIKPNWRNCSADSYHP